MRINKTTPAEIMKYRLTGEGSGTGYFNYIDLETHEDVIDVYEAGELKERHRAQNDEEFKGIVEKIKND